VTQHATGPFDVKLAPLDPAFESDETSIGRMSIDKQFHRDLEATSKGEMLYVGNAKTSGGYVAIERVSGILHGRQGTFILQHNATMTRGTPRLNIIAVPGTSTGQLAGLTGSMNIIIAPGRQALLRVHLHSPQHVVAGLSSRQSWVLPGTPIFRSAPWGIFTYAAAPSA
jgi:hypothetical protein